MIEYYIQATKDHSNSHGMKIISAGEYFCGKVSSNESVWDINPQFAQKISDNNLILPEGFQFIPVAN